MKRRLILILTLLYIFVNTFGMVSSTTVKASNNSWPSGPNIFAQAAIVMEASTGLILYEKNMNQQFYPASITKIMTGLLGAEKASLSDVITFSREAIFNVDLRSSRIGIDVGEKLTMQQALYGVLLESANEVSYGVAEYIGGDIPTFAKMMNDRAKEIGCLNTNFVNPHGLPDEQHLTTAYDMALITKEAMKNETFRKIFGTRTYQIPPTNIQKETRYLRNHHRFVLKQQFLYNDCIGGKTGYTSKAGYTLVSVAKRGDMELICVILKDDTFEHQYTDTQKLFDFGFNNFSVYPITSQETSQAIQESPMFTRYNTLLNMAETPVKTDSKGYLILPNNASVEDATKEVTFTSNNELKEGTNIIGQISYTYNGKYVGGASILYENKISNSLQNITATPVPTELPKEPEPVKKQDTVPSRSSAFPVIILFITAAFLILAGFYYFFVEQPRLKRRKAYYRKRQNRRFIENDYMDL